jgi:hypothetical protein
MEHLRDWAPECLDLKPSGQVFRKSIYKGYVAIFIRAQYCFSKRIQRSVSDFIFERRLVNRAVLYHQANCPS